MHPVVHQQTASLEQIAAHVGRLDLICARRERVQLDHLVRMVRPFRGPIPEARSEAWGTAAIPSCCRSFENLASLSGLRRKLGNSSPADSPVLDAPGIRRASPRISATRKHNGTRCSRFAFIRAVGIVQTLTPRPTSSQVAKRTSPDRVAVSTRISKASFVPTQAGDAPAVPRAVAARAGPCRTARRPRHVAQRAVCRSIARRSLCDVA